MSLIPITLVTGWNCSGKSTLIQNLISHRSGERIAWIADSFPAVEPDAANLQVISPPAQIAEIDTEAGRCQVDKALIGCLRELQARRESGLLRFDRLIVESRGSAEPAPMVQSFFADEALCRQFRLDAVVTLLDATQALAQFDSHAVTQDQVGFADRVVLIRSDEIGPDTRCALLRRIQRMNPRARTLAGRFEPGLANELLDIRGFALTGRLEIEEAALDETDCRIDDGVSSFVFRTRDTLDKARVEEFFSSLLLVYGSHLMRYKGVVSVSGAERPVVIQGVHRLMGTDADDDWKKGDPRDNRIVFIGRSMPREVIVQGLKACLVPAGAAAAPPRRTAIKHGSTVLPPFKRKT